MNKKTIILIVVIILLVIVGAVIYFASQNSNQTEGNNNQENLAEQTDKNTQANNAVAETNSVENTETGDGKILVVYYSATGNTEAVAQKIANNLGADVFEIVPAQEYSSTDLDWTDSL